MVAIAVVGNVQFLKGAFKKAPSWVWSIAAVVLCVGYVALAALVGAWMLYASVALAIVQMGYEILLQGVPMLIKKLLGLQDQQPSGQGG